MQYNDKRPYGQTTQEMEYPTPPPPTIRNEGQGAMNIGLSVVAVVMFTSLFFSGINVAVTVVSTALFYGGIIVLVLLINSGTLGYWLGKREEEQTKREELRQIYWQRVRVADPAQIPYTEPAPTPQALPASSSFVAPQAEPDNSIKREATMWLYQLYGADGQPDPRKVLLQSDKEKPGRIRIAGPSRPAKEYLLQRHIIHDLGNGYRLNIARYPTRAGVEHALILSDGVGGVPTEYHHSLESGAA